MSKISHAFLTLDYSLAFSSCRKNDNIKIQSNLAFKLYYHS